jgi:hypothetical protein
MIFGMSLSLKGKCKISLENRRGCPKPFEDVHQAYAFLGKYFLARFVFSMLDAASRSDRAKQQAQQPSLSRRSTGISAVTRRTSFFLTFEDWDST